MRIQRERCQRLFARGTVVCLAAASILTCARPTSAQYVEIQAFEVTPLVGATLGGTFGVQPDGAEAIDAEWNDAASYGLAAGVRFDDFSLIEVRWTRAKSTLRFSGPFNFLGAAVGDVTLNQIHADFTREFALPTSRDCDRFSPAASE
jgi:hypothetical protein